METKRLLFCLSLLVSFSFITACNKNQSSNLILERIEPAQVFSGDPVRFVTNKDCYHCQPYFGDNPGPILRFENISALTDNANEFYIPVAYAPTFEACPQQSIQNNVCTLEVKIKDAQGSVSQSLILTILPKEEAAAGRIVCPDGSLGPDCKDDGLPEFPDDLPGSEEGESDEDDKGDVVPKPTGRHELRILSNNVADYTKVSAQAFMGDIQTLLLADVLNVNFYIKRKDPCPADDPLSAFCTEKTRACQLHNNNTLLSCPMGYFDHRDQNIKMLVLNEEEKFVIVAVVGGSEMTKSPVMSRSQLRTMASLVEQPKRQNNKADEPDRAEREENRRGGSPMEPFEIIQPIHDLRVKIKTKAFGTDNNVHLTFCPTNVFQTRDGLLPDGCTQFHLVPKTRDAFEVGSTETVTLKGDLVMRPIAGTTERDIDSMVSPRSIKHMKLENVPNGSNDARRWHVESIRVDIKTSPNAAFPWRDFYENDCVDKQLQAFTSNSVTFDTEMPVVCR